MAKISFGQANCLSVIGISFGFGMVFCSETLSKRLMTLIAAIGLAGCSSVSFVSQEPSPESIPVTATKSVPVKQSVVKLSDIPVTTTAPVAKPVAASILKPVVPSGESYRYGSFIVEVAKDGTQKVVGGEFTPETKTPLPTTEPCSIFVDFNKKKLSAYCKNAAGVDVPIVGYAVVTPLPSALSQDVVHGVVTNIVWKPSWCPTPTMLKTDPKLKPGCVPYGDPTNPMGIVKHVVAWDIPGYKYVRLHGSKGYPKKFFEVETDGCTALEDTAIRYLTDELTNRLGGNVKGRIGVYMMKGEGVVGALQKDDLSSLSRLIGTGN